MHQKSFSTVFLWLTLTSGFPTEEGEEGVSHTNNKVSHCSTSTDMTIMSLLVNVGNHIIISSFTFFKPSAYPHDLNQNTNAIEFHLQMLLPRVWGKYGFTDLPKITNLNHWEHKHTPCTSSLLSTTLYHGIPPWICWYENFALPMFRENTGVHFAAIFPNCTPSTHYIIYQSNSSHNRTLLIYVVVKNW